MINTTKSMEEELGNEKKRPVAVRPSFFSAVIGGKP